MRRRLINRPVPTDGATVQPQGRRELPEGLPSIPTAAHLAGRRAGVESAAVSGLGVHPMSAHPCPHLSRMTGHRLRAWFDAGFVAARGLRGGLPNVEPQAVTPGLTPLDLPGMGDAGLARFQGHSPAAPVFRQPRLTSLAHGTLGLSGDQIIRIAPHGRCAAAGKRARDRLCQSVEGHVGSHGRAGATWRGPGFQGQPDALVAHTTLQPGVDLPT